MKALKSIIGRLIVGCVLPLSLTIELQAQDQESPPGTYYSAKDPDIGPLPFNPHPELPVVEVEKGIFIVDDTSIPDTPEQAAARAASLAASQQPPDPPQAAAERQAAIADAEQAQFAVNFAPWTVQQVLMPDGSPLIAQALEIQNLNSLLSLSASISSVYTQQQAAVSDFVETNLMGLPAWWMDTIQPRIENGTSHKRKNNKSARVYWAFAVFLCKRMSPELCAAV